MTLPSMLSPTCIVGYWCTLYMYMPTNSSFTQCGSYPWPSFSFLILMNSRLHSDDAKVHSMFLQLLDCLTYLLTALSLKFKRLWTIMTHAVGPLLSSNRTAYCNAILWNVCVSSSLHPFLAWREGSRFFPCSYNCFLWRVFCLSRGFFCRAS